MAGMHRLFLSFDGVTIANGDCDDSRTNCSSLVLQSSTMVPAFLEGQGDRQVRIGTITAMVQEAIAPFSIDAVTARPTSGNYWMISIGGTSAVVTGVPDALLATRPVCDAMNRNAIAFVFEQDADDPLSDRAYADVVAGAFGSLVGLVATTRNGDCMCTQSTCTHTRACTWGTTTVPQTPNPCMRTVQNEQQVLMDAIGCR